MFWTYNIILQRILFLYLKQLIDLKLIQRVYSSEKTKKNIFKINKSMVKKMLQPMG